MKGKYYLLHTSQSCNDLQNRHKQEQLLTKQNNYKRLHLRTVTQISAPWNCILDSPETFVVLKSSTFHQYPVGRKTWYHILRNSWAEKRERTLLLDWKQQKRTIMTIKVPFSLYEFPWQGPGINLSIKISYLQDQMVLDLCNRGIRKISRQAEGFVSLHLV